MWAFVQSMARDVERMTGPLGREHWIGICVVVLVVGTFFLRGFGSRTGY